MRSARGLFFSLTCWILMLTDGPCAAQDYHLTLREAVRLALQQNHSAKISRFKIAEAEQKKARERSAYFPTLTNQSNVLHTSDLEIIGLPAGAFGRLPGVGPVPAQNINIPQGQRTLVSSGTMLAQPLTQLIRIRKANAIATSEVASAQAELKKLEDQIAVRVHEVYFGILIARRQKTAAERQISYNTEHLRESEEALRSGSALRAQQLGAQAELLESKQSLLTEDLRLADLNAELNDLIGLPLETQLDLDEVIPVVADPKTREEYLRQALAENPEIRIAEEAVKSANAAVQTAKAAYIPDITAFARHSYQDGVPFLVRSFGTFGINLNYDIFDFGKRRALVRQHEAQLVAAEQNVKRLRDSVAVDIQRIYNKVARTKQMVDVASAVVKLREETERLAENQLTLGAVLGSDLRQASAASAKAYADLLQVQLAYSLSRAELDQAIGRTPGL